MKKILALAMAALLCASSACAETIQIGDKGGDVLKIQEELYHQGYLSDEADGIFGENTAEAVRAFQEATGVEATGMVDEDTLQLLLNGGVAEMRTARQRLEALGYLKLDKSGDIDAQTTEALERFQRMNGLSVTGKLDETTSKLLLDTLVLMSASERIQERLNELGYLSSVKEGQLEDVTADVIKTFQSANGLEPDGNMGNDTILKLFSQDVQGNDARMAQRRLIDLGFLNGSADGVFGEKSVAALKQFQTLQGLEVTGQLDEATLAELYSEAAAKVHPLLVNGDSGNAVKELQQKLIDMGFLNDRADGIFGDNTEKAVAAFQEHLNDQGRSFSVTGKATPETQDILFDETYSCYLSDVHPGDEKYEVLRMERRLHNLGFMDATPDRVFDSYAAQCLEAFQTAAGLVETGYADITTINALFGGETILAERYVPRALYMGESGGIAKDVQEALIRMGLMTGAADDVYGEKMEDALKRLYIYLDARDHEAAALFETRGTVSAEGQEALASGDLFIYHEDIQKGANEMDAMRLQCRLSTLFYLSEDGIDGDYGNASKTAVEKFQKNNGLEVTGIADEATQRALFSDAAAGNWTPYKLEVSIGEQRVYAYALNADGQYELVRTFICSTGLGDLTPVGVFSSTTEPLDRWHYFYKFKCWAQYAWRITGPYYFHSVIYSQRDESTLRMSSVYNLGHKASHGCIRLEVEAAKWIYENCEAGTIVIIHND